MTPTERTLFAKLVCLLGVVTEDAKIYATETRNGRAKYAVEKAERALLQLFGALEYERQPAELAELKRFVMGSRLFILSPEDSDVAEALMEKEKAWLEATEESRRYALGLHKELTRSV